MSASYLSQVKNGKRPPTEKVLSKLLSNGYQLVNLAIESDFGYNQSALGNSLTVGQRTLDPSVKVRILLPQPSHTGKHHYSLNTSDILPVFRFILSFGSNYNKI